MVIIFFDWYPDKSNYAFDSFEKSLNGPTCSLDYDIKNLSAKSFRAVIKINSKTKPFFDIQNGIYHQLEKFHR